MPKNEYLVYVHIFPNGKQYVGMTKSAEKRWARKGSNYKYNERMYKDIQKFGWDNIQHLILHSGLSKKRAFEVSADGTSVMEEASEADASQEKKRRKKEKKQKKQKRESHILRNMGITYQSAMQGAGRETQCME